MSKSSRQNDVTREHPTSTTVPASSSASLAPADTPDEDVFDPSEYVKDLIARMDGRGVSTRTPTGTDSKPAPSATTATITNAERPRPVTVDKPAKRATRAEEIGLNENLPIDPRQMRSKPRSPVNLEKLREAANLTSSSDLSVSTCNVLVRRAYLDLIIAIGCMMVVIVMLTLARGMYSVAYLASTVALALACGATFRYARNTQALWKSIRAQSTVATSGGVEAADETKESERTVTDATSPKGSTRGPSKLS